MLDHFLALTAEGVVSFGSNDHGQRSALSRFVDGLPEVPIAIAAGGDSSFALLADGEILGWGNNATGQLGVVYDRARQATVEGVVTEFRFVDPHPMLMIEVDVDGVREAWQLEMDNRRELARIGFTPETFLPGDQVVASGSLHRVDPVRLYMRRLDRPADGLRYEQRGSTPTLELRRR